MILILAAILLILAIAFFQITQGLFSALIMAFSSIAAAMIAFNYYEPIASALLYTRQPATADAGVLLGLFIVSLFVLLGLFNFLLKDNVEMGVWADRIGGGALGLISGAVMVGVLAVALQMLPVAEMVGYKPFNESLTREGNTNRLGVDEAVVGMMKTFSGGAFSGETSLQKVHSDLLLESFAAVNDAGKNGRIDALPDALNVKAASIVTSVDSAPWCKDVPNPDKTVSTQVLVVRAHVDEQAKDENGYFVLPATQFRLVTRAKQDPQQVGKSYYPVGYLTYSTVDAKGCQLWTAPADEKSKLPGLTKLLVSRPSKANGLYVDWVYRIGNDETPAYMIFRRTAKAAVPATTEHYDQDNAEALDKNPVAFPKVPEPAKPRPTKTPRPATTTGRATGD